MMAESRAHLGHHARHVFAISVTKKIHSHIAS